MPVCVQPNVLLIQLLIAVHQSSGIDNKSFFIKKMDEPEYMGSKQCNKLRAKTQIFRNSKNEEQQSPISLNHSNKDLKKKSFK